MYDIGYYAGFLSPEKQQEVRDADIAVLVDALDDLASDLDVAHRLRPNIFVKKPFVTASLSRDVSDRDKLALIRGLCDRIELKLMEQAK